MVYQNYQSLICGPRRKPLRFAGYGLFLALLFSCASTPSAPETFYAGRSGFALMAEGADLYITADVQSSRPILDSLVLGGLKGSEIKSFLDMSDTLTAAIFPFPGERYFCAAASGRFPSGRGGFFFSTSKDWEKRTSSSGMSYWYSPQSRLSISLTSRFACLSDADPFIPPPGVQIPEALPALQRGSVLSGWVNNPAQALNRIIAAFEVPIEIPADRLLFAVYPADKRNEKYNAVLRFETPTPTQAAALVRIFMLAKLGLALTDFSENKDMKTLAEALFFQTPRQDGSALILTTGTMNGSGLALLFNTISVY